MFEITEETRKAAVDKMIEILVFQKVEDRAKFEEAFDEVVKIVKAQFGL